MENFHKVLISSNKLSLCASGTPASSNKHHLLLPSRSRPPSPSSPPFLASLFVSLLPIPHFSTHISLCDSQVLCCTTELRSLPAISTLHLWNPSWLPRPFTAEGCHLPHGGAGGGAGGGSWGRGVKRLRRRLGVGWGVWSRWGGGHSQGHSSPFPPNKPPPSSRGNCRST